jgi:uncharacterized protein YaiL (DUF2058 family)
VGWAEQKDKERLTCGKAILEARQILQKHVNKDKAKAIKAGVKCKRQEREEEKVDKATRKRYKTQVRALVHCNTIFVTLQHHNHYSVTP